MTFFQPDLESDQKEKEAYIYIYIYILLFSLVYICTVQMVCMFVHNPSDLFITGSKSEVMRFSDEFSCNLSLFFLLIFFFKNYFLSNDMLIFT
jgi:hypothetical protein